MIAEQFEIIALFSGSMDTELTINQIAKGIKKSYAFTNKYTHELIELKLLKTKEVGPSILCSLNYHSTECFAALVYNSIRRTMTKRHEDSFEIPVLDSSIDIIMRHKKETIMVSESTKEHEKGRCLDMKSFASLLHTLDLAKVTIYKGHELFWRTVSTLAR